MLIYDTLTKQKKPFLPRKLGEVDMFVCGPTVYDSPHIGHGRSYVVFDVVARYLKYLGYDVKYRINITDIDDKIIDRAKAEGVPVREIADRYDREFGEAMCKLGVFQHDWCYATDFMEVIIDQIKRLEEKGFTYLLSDGVYFDIARFPEHGKLSGRPGGVGHEESDFSRIGSRDDKRNPGDFVLWKLEKPGEAEVGAVWESPWGRGRPGWHIEDTAITEDIFGPQYDIHGGGIDLIFPHHEAEITQIEAVSGKKPLVNFWMHNGHLMVDGQKMSKSLGNYLTIADALKKWDAQVLRYFFLSAHYRSSLNFTEEAVNSAQAAVEKLNDFILMMKQMQELGPEPTIYPGQVCEVSAIGRETLNTFYHKNDLCIGTRRNFERAMSNDFNISAALAIIFMFMNGVNKLIEEGGCNREVFSRYDAGLVLQLMWFWNEILGVMNFDCGLNEDIQIMVKDREKLRTEKKWPEADNLRQKMNGLGYDLKDTPKGTIVRKKF